MNMMKNERDEKNQRKGWPPKLRSKLTELRKAAENPDFHRVPGGAMKEGLMKA